MKQVRIQRLLFLIAIIMFGFFAQSVSANTFLEPDQAFKLESELRDTKMLVVSWTIAPGYHLYRDRLNFQSQEGEVKLGQPKLPAGLREFDSNFNKEVETYRDHLAVEIPVAQVGNVDQVFAIKIGYQGCADAGLCYPPMEKTFLVDMAKSGKLILQSSPKPPLKPNTKPTLAPASSTSISAPISSTASMPAPKVDTEIGEDDTSLAQRTLQSGSIWKIGSAFLVFGLLLSFTPCVLPMVPILSSIIVGEGAVSRGRGFLLAFTYCMGMALVYTSLGVAAGMAGEGLAGALQKPAVLLTFGALLVGLALSMFDVYQLQLPSGLQSRLSQASGNVRGGRFIGVFVMGALSALIVGPCVAGPLAGALLYISQTRNVFVGGWALFSMAIGMSAPLLLTGISAGSLLPRVGIWMIQVKRLFGLLLIAVAIWMISPLFTVPATMAIWGGFAILCAVFMHVFEPVSGAELRGYFLKAFGLVLLLGGVFELVGAASSGTDVLQPLAHLHVTSVTRITGGDTHNAIDSTRSDGEARFTRIHNAAELDQILNSTKTPVMLDFYADWCVSCKEMERFTFSDKKVGELLKTIRLVQIDVTANNDDDRALMKRFNLFGPPGIIMFSVQGREVPQSRVIGFLGPEPFYQRLLVFLDT
jgi:thiol:disulfide interchange protein DsbD